MPKHLLLLVSILLFIYMFLPGPTSIQDFSPLPGSVKSELEGDTIQVPNVAGYFSNHYRDFATDFYFLSFWNNSWLPFPPIKLNYPPEFAFTAIKDQTQATYLEEYIYPLRGSLFVNGMEPLTVDRQPKYPGAIPFEIGDQKFDTKVTLRFYPSNLLVRLLVWGGIVLSIMAIWKFSKGLAHE